MSAGRAKGLKMANRYSRDFADDYPPNYYPPNMKVK